MAESGVPLRKEIRDNLTRYGMQSLGGLHKKGLAKKENRNKLSRQIYAVPGLCCVVSRRLVESVGGVFDLIVNSATAVFEHIKDELAVLPCLLLATL